MLIEYVPFGDLLGYLRKSRGLNDTYYKDPDIKPKTSLTSQQLMKFAWQIADGMSYLSSKRVCNVLSYWTFVWGLCKVRTGWRRMADGGWRIEKCGWKNVDDKMGMKNCQ